MKRLFLFPLILVVLFPTPVFSQEQNQQTTSKAAVDSLNKRIAALEMAINEQIATQKAAEDQDKHKHKEQFKNSISTILTGLEMGSEIELIVPSTLRLIATKDLNETLNAINNPTSNSVGTPFSEMVIESASIHLLPRFTDENLKQQAKMKFRGVLEAIYKGPIVQGLINSNPISSTINAAIRQAGFFEKPRGAVIEVSRDQIRNVSNNKPIKVPVNTANVEGPAFSKTEMEEFNADLEKRIEFYATMNQYGITQNEITQQLYVDAKLIKKSVKASKSEICRLLSIDPNNASASLSAKFDNVSLDQMKDYLKDPNFKKAVSLSDYAREQLPEVKEFNQTVVNALVKYIDGYIKILNDYKGIESTKLDPVEINKQIAKLNTIKRDVSTPL